MELFHAAEDTVRWTTGRSGQWLRSIDRKATLVLAVSLPLGLGVELMPDILTDAPDVLKGIFSSGITGGLAAIVANLLIRVKEEKQYNNEKRDKRTVD